jgi:formylglycine-generating enzyme required for sulfatase activity
VHLIRPHALALAALLFALPAQAIVDIEWVTVGDPGNVGDLQESCYECGPGMTFGAVPYEYRIGKFEVTNAEYTEFLNAVAATDTNEVYSVGMGTATHYGGITRSGSSGSYTYSTVAGHENWPVSFIYFWSAVRFANWLHNGQPTGAQDDTTTEDGAYTLTPIPYPIGHTYDTGTHNPGARVYLPSEDEWYKAAYYKGGSTNAGYWAYPARSDTETTCTPPGATANTADCDWNWDGSRTLTDVGSYMGSVSPSGTFDQGGNVWEWNESVFPGGRYGFPLRGIRGGAISGPAYYLGASLRGLEDTTDFYLSFGFRVASPAPATSSVPSLGAIGITVLFSLLGLAGLRKLHS